MPKLSLALTSTCGVSFHCTGTVCCGLRFVDEQQVSPSVFGAAGFTSWFWETRRTSIVAWRGDDLLRHRARRDRNGGPGSLPCRTISICPIWHTVVISRSFAKPGQSSNSPRLASSHKYDSTRTVTAGTRIYASHRLPHRRPDALLKRIVPVERVSRYTADRGTPV